VTSLADTRLLTAAEVAELLAVSDRTVRTYAETGVLPAIRFTRRGRLRFAAQDIEDLLDRARRGCGTASAEAAVELADRSEVGPTGGLSRAASERQPEEAAA
jgi:excisionase family DNA binding protein